MFFVYFSQLTRKKSGKKTVVTVFFPFFTIISFFNFTQLLVFHTYQAERPHSLCNLSVRAVPYGIFSSENSYL